MPIENLQELQQLHRELEQDGQLDQNYRNFLQAVSAAEAKMTELHRPDLYGRIKRVDAGTRTELMGLLRQIGKQADPILKAEAGDENAQRHQKLVRKITALASGYHGVMQLYEPERKPQTLNALLTEARTRTLDTRSAVLLDEVSNMANRRQPLTFLDDRGRPISGVFTPKREATLRQDLQRKIAEIKQRNRNPRGNQILDNFVDLLAASGAKKKQADFNSLSENQKLGMLDRFLEEIVYGPPYQLNREKVKRSMEEAFADVLGGSSVFSAIPKKDCYELCQVLVDHTADIMVNFPAAGIPDGGRIDSRNSAMSAVADLLGVPNLIARSMPIKVIDKNGKTVEGTFMAEAEGVDCKNPSEKAEGIDRNAVRVEEPEDAEAIGGACKSISDLQVLDYICGNVDRTFANMLYQFNDRKKLCNVQGIDNDCAFGLIVPKEGEQAKELPALTKMRAISRSMYNTVTNLTKETLRFSLRGFGLSEAELDAACERLGNLKKKLEADRQYYDTHPLDQHEFVRDRIRIVEDDEWKTIKYKELERTHKEPDVDDPTQLALVCDNTYANAKSGFERLNLDYQERRTEFRSLKSEIAIGAGNRAIPDEQAKEYRRTVKLAGMFARRTTQDRSTPAYDDVEKALEAYAECQYSIMKRIEAARKNENDPDAPYESIVSTADLEEMRKLGKALQTAAQNWLDKPEKARGGFTKQYIAQRKAVVQMALEMGRQASVFNTEELDLAEQNERLALEEVNRRVGDKLEQSAEMEQVEAGEQEPRYRLKFKPGQEKPFGPVNDFDAENEAEPQPQPQANL